jgi:hypothetical protein
MEMAAVVGYVWLSTRLVWRARRSLMRGDKAAEQEQAQQRLRARASARVYACRDQAFSVEHCVWKMVDSRQQRRLW